jgi:hypothetical protein
MVKAVAVVMVVVVMMMITKIRTRHHGEKTVMMVMMMVVELRRLHRPLLRRTGGHPGIIGLQRIQRIRDGIEKVSIAGSRRSFDCRFGGRLDGMHCGERRRGAENSDNFLVHGFAFP